MGGAAAGVALASSAVLVMRALRWAIPLTAAAALVAPGLYAVEGVLDEYQQTVPSHEDTTGIVTARQYAEVRKGQTRTELHKKLGPGLPDIGTSEFPPAAAGLLCDEYVEFDFQRVYQLCFRADVLVSKKSAVGK